MLSVRIGRYALTVGFLASVVTGAVAAPGGVSTGSCGAREEEGGECRAQGLVSQEDYERVQAILEQAGMGGKAGADRIEEQREQAEIGRAHV